MDRQCNSDGGAAFASKGIQWEHGRVEPRAICHGTSRAGAHPRRLPALPQSNSLGRSDLRGTGHGSMHVPGRCRPRANFRSGLGGICGGMAGRLCRLLSDGRAAA